VLIAENDGKAYAKGKDSKMAVDAAIMEYRKIVHRDLEESPGAKSKLSSPRKSNPASAIAKLLRY
jgi:hypothetical protein